MNTTKTPPTEPGYYFVKLTPNNKWAMACVDGVWVWLSCENYPRHLKYYPHALCSERIPTPDETPKQEAVPPERKAEAPAPEAGMLALESRLNHLDGKLQGFIDGAMAEIRSLKSVNVATVAKPRNFHNKD